MGLIKLYLRKKEEEYKSKKIGEKKMMKTLETVVAVHTHTHTHTDILLEIRNNQVACLATRVSFLFDTQKLDTG